MGSMRQRLLLVAGWAAAAVVASLVSTGAVAVAGGQVADRPHSPLSASEVAALAEEYETSERAPSLRQPDNSDRPTTSAVAAPDLDSSQDGDGQGVSPSSNGEELPAADPLEDPEDLLVPEDEITPEPSGQIVELVGARVSVAGADGEVTVIWAIPRSGFAPLRAGSEVEDGVVTLVFSDGSHRSTMTAEWDTQEGLVVKTTEGAPNVEET